MSGSTRSSQESVVPQSQHSLPITPTPMHAELPGKQNHPGTVHTTAASLTPPPSSQHRIKFASPQRMPLLIDGSRLRDTLLGPSTDLESLQGQMATLPASELRDAVDQLALALHDAKTTTAHYKLQHHMSQMESGEAVERMAVEMEMARREIEVLQQAEAHRKLQEQSRGAALAGQTNFRQVHNDIYDAMIDDIRDLKAQNAHLEQEVNHSRRILAHQENEIASLNDKVSLMRDRIRESREQLFRSRKQGAVDSTPQRANRAISPFQTPTRERFAVVETPRTNRQPQLQPQSQTQPRPRQQQQQQPGFAALLQATDMVSQGVKTPSGDQRRGHARNSQSMSSVPTTPSRQARPGPHVLYTPQPIRQLQVQVPNTAPIPRKRGRDALTPPPVHTRTYDSDDTVSAVDEDSEAETEVADGDLGHDQAGQTSRDVAHGRVIKRVKSAHNVKTMTQTRLFGQVRKYDVVRDEGPKVQDENASAGVEGELQHRQRA